MATLILVQGNRLRLPDGAIIDNCWDEDGQWLLSKKAGIALIPFLTDEERHEAKHTKLVESLDPEVDAYPEHAPLYQYEINGEPAFVGFQVKQDDSTIFLGEGEKTGRIYFSPLCYIEQILGIK